MRSMVWGAMLPVLVGMVSVAAAQPAKTGDLLVFVSSFAPAGEGGIQAYKLNTTSGSLTPAHRTTDVAHPFFMALSPDRRFLYSIHATEFGAQAPEAVAAYRVEGANGELKLLNRQSSKGTASCYLDVDATGKTVLVANYSTGSVASFHARKDGSLDPATSFVQHTGSSVDASRQKEAHAHAIVISPDNRYAYAPDLGLDQIVSYRLDAGKNTLTPNRQPFVRTSPGVGPRHFTFHPDGKHAYAINELKNSVTLFDYEAKTGILIERQTISTLPAGFTGTSYCADLKITPNGRYLYGTNRGHDSIAMYRIGAEGKLSLIGIEPSLGKGPQNLAITPGGELLLCANMPGNNVALFRIDAATGKLASTGTPVALKSPSCIRVLP